VKRSQPYVKTSDWIGNEHIPKNERQAWLFLLPAGEGQDEGERLAIMLATKF
jgi:hypothetical protein